MSKETLGPAEQISECTAVDLQRPMLQGLMDLELPLAVVLGAATVPIQDVLKFNSGSLIELDRNVDAYVDLVVHGTVVALGEIVSVKGNYGVRIKEIMSPQDRLALPPPA